MKTKTVYVANDGKEFSTKVDCENYDAELLLWEKLQERFSVYGDVTVTDREEFIDFIHANSDIILKILGELK